MPRRLALSLLFVALVLPQSAGGALYLRLGFVDDTLKWIGKPHGYVGAQRELGAPFTRIMIPWRRGETVPRPVVRIYLDRAAFAAALRQKIVLAVYNTAAEAPTDARSREQYCAYAAWLLRRIPNLAAIVIWNEANSPDYWPQSAGAPAYEALLARCYDVLHAIQPNVNVIDSTAAHYDPAGFIAELGRAYRESGRDRSIVDTFGHNPYPEYAAEDPWATHPGTGTIGEGDYETLIAALTAAFQFTAQRPPSAAYARLWYLEDGFQTAVPPLFRPLYSGRENDPTVLPPLGPAKSQASQLAAAIALAFCQPATSGFFNFKLVDDHRLGGWQSGLMYANGVRKPSYDAYRAIAAAVAARAVDCTKVMGAPSPQPSSRARFR